MEQIARSLYEINQGIRDLFQAALAGEISFATARYEIQKLADERKLIFAQ